MKRLLLAVALWAGLLCPALAQLSGGLQFPGPGTAHSTGGGAYIGPGDLTLSSVAPVGAHMLRAYSSAKATAHANDVRISDSGGANPLVLTLLTNGDMDTSGVAAWVALHGTAFVDTIYDQVGSKDETASGAARPTLTLSGLGGKPVLTCSGAQDIFSAVSYAQAQPFSLSLVAKRTIASGGFDDTFQDGSRTGMLFGTASGVMSLYAQGAPTSAAATDNLPFSFQGVFSDGASASRLYVNGGAGTSVNGIGSASFTNPHLCGNPGGGHLTGIVSEAIIYSGAMSSGDASSLTSNQRGYWGF